MTAYQPVQTMEHDWRLTEPMLHQMLHKESPSHAESKRGTSLREEHEENIRAAVAHDAVLRRIRELFVMSADLPEGFLFAHRAIPRLLLEGASHLRACFGSETVFTLRAPIDDSGSRTLYAVVMWPGSVREVRMALEHFDETWWIANSRQSSGYLTFTYELV